MVYHSVQLMDLSYGWKPKCTGMKIYKLLFSLYFYLSACLFMTSLYVHLYFFSVFLPVFYFLCTCLSVCTVIHLFICLFEYLFLFLYFLLFLSVSVSLCLSIYSSIHLSIYLPIYLFIYLYINLYIYPYLYICLSHAHKLNLSFSLSLAKFSNKLSKCLSILAKPCSQTKHQNTYSLEISLSETIKIFTYPGKDLFLTQRKAQHIYTFSQNLVPQTNKSSKCLYVLAKSRS